MNEEQNLSVDTRVIPREISVNESLMYQTDYELFLKSKRVARKTIVNQYKSDILNVITNDIFEAGIISQSEFYISDTANEDNVEYIREAANELYLEYYNNPHILTGLLIMMGTLNYEKAEPQGQTMALGLLQHEDISVRDRAIQAFERWNSKKGLTVLKSLHCDIKWLERYVNKVISYLERDGKDQLPYLVRKLNKRENIDIIGNTENVENMFADAATSEFRSKNGTLSTWRIEFIEKLDEAILAIVVTSSKIERMDFIVINTEYLDEQHLEYAQTYAG